MNVAKVALMVALYGAVLSTIVGLCRLVAWYQKRRGRVRVTVDTSYFMRDSDDEGLGPCVRFKAVNDGEKPVKITGLTLRVRDQELDLTPCSQGTRNLRILSQGEDFDRLILLERLLDEIRGKTPSPPPRKAKAIFHSNTGRKWCRSFRLPRPG